MTDDELDRLLAEAAATNFEGWDFRWIEGRFIEEPPSWNLADLVRSRLSRVGTFLDLGTGGGEFLSSLAPLPSLAVATEAYPPNVSVAARRLAPLEVGLISVEAAPDNDEWQGEGGRLPFRTATFDLVMSRHEAYSPTEVSRVLRPGAIFITEQLGGNSGEEAEFRGLFGRKPHGRVWDLGRAIDQIEGAGLVVESGGEEFPDSKFVDVGALAYYLKACPWVIEGFDIVNDREWLLRIHERILRDGPLVVPAHVYWFEARKP